MNLHNAHDTAFLYTMHLDSSAELLQFLYEPNVGIMLSWRKRNAHMVMGNDVNTEINSLLNTTCNIPAQVTEMMQEQPMVDATLLSLVHVTDTEASGQGHSRLSDTTESSISTITSSSTKSEPLAPKFISRIARFESGPDEMLDKMEELRSIFQGIAADPVKELNGLPAIERDISAIVSYPPPTWSMLQEVELIKTCNPVMPLSSKGARLKEFPKPQPPAPLTYAQLLRKNLSTTDREGHSLMLAATPLASHKKPTSLDSFRPRPGLLGTNRGGPFVMTLGTGKEPSSVGMDDTMKSPSELKLEQDSRKTWEKRSTHP